MLGHYPNVEKSQLVNYVEDYLECVESLPLDIQRNVSLLREIDTKYQGKRNICQRYQRGMMYIYVHLHRVHFTPETGVVSFPHNNTEHIFIKHLSGLPKLSTPVVFYLYVVFGIFSCVCSSNTILPAVISHFD